MMAIARSRSGCPTKTFVSDGSSPMSVSLWHGAVAPELSDIARAPRAHRHAQVRENLITHLRELITDSSIRTRDGATNSWDSSRRQGCCEPPTPPSPKAPEQLLAVDRLLVHDADRPCVEVALHGFGAAL